ncbi:hypothetical protein [Streptomyces sp. HU2014]|nr:hypothetical protein [Streptomyces sp. HU2014]
MRRIATALFSTIALLTTVLVAPAAAIGIDIAGIVIETPFL